MTANEIVTEWASACEALETHKRIVVAYACFQSTFDEEQGKRIIKRLQRLASRERDAFEALVRFAADDDEE